jgi:alpha-amylase
MQVQADLLNKLSGLGVAGVRMDATKHMAVSDVSAVWSRVKGLYANMEIIQSGDELPFGRDYDAIGSPWEFKVSAAAGRGHSMLRCTRPCP